MTKKLLLGILFLVSLSAFTQENKKWSIEAETSTGIFYNFSGIIDIGTKYRFLDSRVIQVGLGLNVGLYSTRLGFFDADGVLQFSDSRETNWIFTPKIIAEFKIPGIERLRPSLGIGYSFITSKFNGDFLGESVSTTSFDDGFNLNVGLSYDITKSLFIQAQYEFISLNDNRRNLGFLKFGVGFRF